MLRLWNHHCKFSKHFISIFKPSLCLQGQGGRGLECEQHISPFSGGTKPPSLSYTENVPSTVEARSAGPYMGTKADLRQKLPTLQEVSSQLPMANLWLSANLSPNTIPFFVSKTICPWSPSRQGAQRPMLGLQVNDQVQSFHLHGRKVRPSRDMGHRAQGPLSWRTPYIHPSPCGGSSDYPHSS